MSLVFDSGLSIYRKTLKRIRPIHAGLHWAMTHAVIPVLERVQGFRTMPDDPLWFRIELLTGRHEKETVQEVAKRIKPDMVILDIGAHVGYYARRFAQLTGKNGRVVSFEPHPHTVQTLTHNVEKFGNVTVAQVAVADREGTAELYDYLMMSASGSLHYDESLRDLQKAHTSKTDIAPRLAADMPIEKFTVRTAPLDQYLQELGISSVDFVKMDIEGAEMAALRGMAGIITASPTLTLIMEYNPQALSASGINPVQAVEDVLGMGFQRVRAIEKNGTLTDLTGKHEAIEARANALMQHMDVINLLFERAT
jgi:FkbM family methyltransferase